METGQLEKTIFPSKVREVTTVRKKLPLLLLSVFLGLVLLISFILLAIILNSNTIYPNVLILNEDVGGYKKEELYNHLENKFASTFNNIFITFSDPQFERTVMVSEMGIKVDIGAMVKKAYSVGREGNFLFRTISILKLAKTPLSIEPIIDSDTFSFNSMLDDICQNVFREIIPSNIVIMEDQVILCTGIAGREAEREQLKAQIIKAIVSFESSDLIVPIRENIPPPLDVETTLYTLNKPPVNAEFIRTSRTTYEIKPHQMGLVLDRAKLMEIVSYVENRESKDYEEIIIPVEFITPDITEEDLKSQIFRDTLSSYTTHFTTNTENNYNRGINIGLAAESIDGTILLPGEKFSFNEVVGPRTVKKGYRTAHIYVAGQIQDGTGGGVCQVSTTLYNAVLRANLEVVERHNHMFTVGYVPLGHDAAVSYGYADLAFTNNTPYPLRIDAVVSYNSSLTFRICSTNDYPNLNVKLATKTINTIPISVVYVNDYTLSKGIEIVAEKGLEGYVVDTYIKIYNGDMLIKEEKLHRSVYQMYPRKILRGAAPTIEIIE